MESDLRSIGELARASGLTVSALRFYDSAGVLVPAMVDPVTGYRWYTDEQVRPARLVAGLRRVGMPVAEIAAAVRAEPNAAHRLLDAHLRRLEDGLVDARRELSRIRTLIDFEERPVTTRIVLSPAHLAAAVDAVRFAVGTDPDLPATAGVLVDVEPDGLRLVATDRYRLAVGHAPGALDGPTVRALAPVGLVDEVRTLLDTGAGDVHLTVAAGSIEVTVAGRTASGTVLPYDFPDWRRLVRTAPGGGQHRVDVDVAELRATLTGADAPTVRREHEGAELAVTVLGPDGNGGVRLLTADDLTAHEPAGGHRTADEPAGGRPAGVVDGFRVGVNGAYLLQAIDAAGTGQLVLELDGPIAPLAVRRADGGGSFSVLMPIRL